MRQMKERAEGIADALEDMCDMECMDGMSDYGDFTISYRAGGKLVGFIHEAVKAKYPDRKCKVENEGGHYTISVVANHREYKERL